jgi:rare lipoprotein A
MVRGSMSNRAALCLLVFAAFADTSLTFAASDLTAAQTQLGIASWYGSGFVGGKTANGEIYRREDKTAAHRTLPFGTYVRVVEQRSGRSTVVRVNNRGPFVRGRVIDLSQAAASEIGLTSRGLTSVKLEVLGKGPEAAKQLGTTRMDTWFQPLVATETTRQSRRLPSI